MKTHEDVYVNCRCVDMVSNMTDTKLGMESVSPVTLSSDWSRLARLIFLASLAAVGSVGNVFMISAVMIEDYLRKRGKRSCLDRNRAGNIND